MPDAYRGVHRLSNEELIDPAKREEIGRKYSDEIREILKRIENGNDDARRVCAFIAEALQSCGGQIIPPRGYMRRVAEHVREHGALVIIDEVQTGFGRVGRSYWAHQMLSAADDNGDDSGFVPDIVTMGKSIGNGYPVAVVVTRREIADALGDEGMPWNWRKLGLSRKRSDTNIVDERSMIIGKFLIINTSTINRERKPLQQKIVCEKSP